MATSQVLYVKGMNVSDSEDESSAEVWDDTKLLKAYDRAVSLGKTEIAKRVAMATNKKTREVKSEFLNKSQKSKSGSSKKSKNTNSSASSHWKTGMMCRTIYEDDGIEYEALVKDIINTEECIVEFLGYKNIEVVPISSLKPSNGNEAREKQIEQAMIDDEDDNIVSQGSRSDKTDSDRTSPASTERSHHKRKQSYKRNRKFSGEVHNETNFILPNMSDFTNMNLGSLDMPMPPPPGFLGGDKPDSEQQAVTSMLLSWYMSGYYTGLYQGMKRAKSTQKQQRE